LTASRLSRAFVERRGATGLIPFVTAGYPSLESTREMLVGFERAGALAVELGIPFSDPIADGPEIQRASEWALRQRVGAEAVLDLVEDFRRDSALPVVLMTYVNPVLRHGLTSFAERAVRSGVDGIIVSDLPPEESPETWDALQGAGLDTITLIAPTTDEARLPALLARCRGFAYCLARTGVTGQGQGWSGSLSERVAAIRARSSLPVAIGFGISGPDDARRLRGLADAVVVGAAFMRRVAEDPAEGASGRVVRFAGELAGALREA
jgi:tryptophan synthase alpha chain